MIRFLWMVPLVLIAGYTVHSLFKYTRMISNIFLGLVYKPDPGQPASVIGERVMILDSADHEIETLVMEAKSARGIVIFCHESGSNHAAWEKYASFLPQQGFHLVSADTDVPYKADEPNGLSQWPQEREVDRLEVVIRWARRVFGAPLPIVLFGVSKGANLALAAAARGLPVHAVIADGLFSMREIFRDYIRKWAPILVRPNLFGEKYPDWVVSIFSTLGFWNSQRLTQRRFIDVEKLLQKEHPPLLMIHGELDDYVPDSHQRYLAKIARQKDLQRVQVRGARHNEAVAVSREEYERHIIGFLEDLLP